MMLASFFSSSGKSSGFIFIGLLALAKAIAKLIAIGMQNIMPISANC
jgi:hypothetical protein